MRNKFLSSVVVLFFFGAALFVSENKVLAEGELLLEENFDTCGFNGQWNASFVRNELYPSGMAPFVAMDGHGCAMMQYVPAGADEVTSAQVGLEGSAAFNSALGSSELEEFYVQWEENFPRDHDFADGSQKLVRFKYWEDGEPLGAEITLQDQYSNGNLQVFMFHPSGTDYGLNTGMSMPVDRWVKMGLWCKLNTPGSSDGFCRVYMDDSQIASVESMNIRGNDQRGFNQMWVGGNHTNQKATVKASVRFIDNIRLFSSKPSSSVSETTTTTETTTTETTTEETTAPAAEPVPVVTPTPTTETISSNTETTVSPSKKQKKQKKQKKHKKQKKQKKPRRGKK